MLVLAVSVVGFLAPWLDGTVVGPSPCDVIDIRAVKLFKDANTQAATNSNKHGLSASVPGRCTHSESKKFVRGWRRVLFIAFQPSGLANENKSLSLGFAACLGPRYLLATTIAQTKKKGA